MFKSFFCYNSIFILLPRTVICYMVAKTGFEKKTLDTWRSEDPGDGNVRSPGGRSALPQYIALSLILELSNSSIDSWTIEWFVRTRVAHAIVIGGDEPRRYSLGMSSWSLGILCARSSIFGGKFGSSCSSFIIFDWYVFKRFARSFGFIYKAKG